MQTHAFGKPTMERNILWYADDHGYKIFVRHGIRVVARAGEDIEGNVPLARRQAAAKAAELALEHRIDAAEVREATEPL